ncbi:MAG: hypothetical protein R3B45_13295 [Bdellovibrionota bacterium]
MMTKLRIKADTTRHPERKKERQTMMTKLRIKAEIRPVILSVSEG